MRLPYFLYLPYPFINTDADQYYGILNLIDSGSKVQIGFPGIGYPLFLWICEKINNTTICVVAIQSLFQLFAVLLFFYYYKIYFKKYLLFVAILISGYLSSNINLYYDSAIHPDSLMGSIFIISIALLIRLFHKFGMIQFIILSCLVVFSIAVRANGIVLLPFIIVYLLYSFYFSRDIKFLIQKTVIFCIPLISLCFYNYFSPLYNSFSLFSYPVENTQSIDGKIILETNEDKTWTDLLDLNLSKNLLVEQSRVDKSLFNDSSYAIYVMAYQRHHVIQLDCNKNLIIENHTETRNKWGNINLDLNSNYSHSFSKRNKYVIFKNKFIAKYGNKKLMISPLEDFKHKTAHFIGFFKMFYFCKEFDIIELGYENTSFYEKNYQLRQGGLSNMFQEGLNINKFLNNRLYKELYNQFDQKHSKGKLIGIMDSDYWSLKSSRVYRWIIHPFYSIQPIIFRNFLYPIIFIVVFFISIIGLFLSKFKSPLFIILFISHSFLLVMNFLFSFYFTFLYTRYTYQVSFVFYISLIFLPLIIESFIAYKNTRKFIY